MVAQAKQRRIDSNEAVVQRRFDVDEYQWMGRVGILRHDEHVELIEGVIVQMSPIGSVHMACVDRFTQRFVSRIGERAIVRVQGAVRLSDRSEPQPDIALLRWRDDFYQDRPARVEDIFLIVEVADSSLAYDLGLKLSMYARAGIEETWVADLPHQRLLAFSRPVDGSYQDRRVIMPGESIAPQSFPDVALTHAEIFGVPTATPPVTVG